MRGARIHLRAAATGLILLGACEAGPQITSSPAVLTPAVAHTTRLAMTPTYADVRPTLAARAVALQESNSAPLFALPSTTSEELADNRMGVLAGGLTGGGWKPGEPWDYVWMADQVTTRGLTRFRVSIDNLDAGSPDLDWSIPQSTIDPSHDALISLLAERGVEMRYVLTFWDKDTWPGGAGAACPRFKEEAQVVRYLEFVRFIVTHFKDRIRDYEIWNEPDGAACPQRIEVEDYIDLVRRAAPVIREAYPEARIVAGSTSYLGEPYTQDYLLTILRSDIMPLVDVVAWHPMYGTSPDFHGEYYAHYPAIVQEITETARAHGFNGTYAADELTWFSSDGQQWDGWSMRYPERTSAKYLARGILMHLGMDIDAGIGSALLFDSKWTLIPSTVRNLATIMAGARPTEFPAEFGSSVDGLLEYGFVLPNGHRLLAFWMNGAASDASPDALATLTVPELAGWGATAVDVMEGFEQQLITTQEGGSLIIPGLHVRDYPILIRFEADGLP